MLLMGTRFSPDTVDPSVLLFFFPLTCSSPYRAIAAEARSSSYSLLALSWIDPHSALLRQLARDPAIPPILLIKHPERAS